MPRPRHCRYVTGSPRADYFKPRGIPMSMLKEVQLSVEGLEAIRLADREGLTASEAAARMRISRFTFGRVLAGARKAVAEALTEGKALHITGGHYEIVDDDSSMAKNKEGSMNRIAISSEGPGLDDLVDPRFGRAGGFVVVDLDSDAVTYVDNGESQAMAHGAGVLTAERLSEALVEVVLSGYVGPKAFEALQAAEISVVQNVDGMTVREAVDAFRAGRLSFADKPNKQG